MMNTTASHSPASKLMAVYQKEIQQELSCLLNYWEKYIPDDEKGGFYGSVNMEDLPDKNALKGIVMNSRILWTFSAATLAEYYDGTPMAQRAYNYITSHFVDKKFGGVYWSLNADGSPNETKKQIYGIAFCIYGLSEYYKLTGNNRALTLAITFFELIEAYGYDYENEGYIEAFTRDWKEIEDVRLSEKEINEKKTMNTHLHIVEAYANLYQVWQSEHLRDKIKNLLHLFYHFIIDKSTGHLHLFMNEKWRVMSSAFSFGHEIEASWLLLECAHLIRDQDLVQQFEEIAFSLAIAASEGLAEDGALYCEYNGLDNTCIKEKHWWPQAEAMVGFFNIWEISKDDSWLEKSMQSWHFVKNHLRCNTTGEWYWGLDEKNQLINEDKAGFWKCPYHNVRACLELLNRIGKY